MNGTPGLQDLGVVVVTYCSGDQLEECFTGLRELVPDARMVVVDSASPDDTVARARGLWPGPRCIPMERNRGFAAAVNLGLGAVEGNFVLVLNADTRTDPDGVRRALDWMLRHPDFGLLGPRLFGVDGVEQPCRGHLPTPGRLAAAYFLRWRGHPGPLRTVDGVEEAESIAGAAMLVRRSAADLAGPMDEEFFLYCEELEWCARMRAAGLRVGTLPEWRLTHVGGASTGQLSVSRSLIAHRSYYRYLQKLGNPGDPRLLQCILLLSLPVTALAALANVFIRRISWREAVNRVLAQGTAALRPTTEVAQC